MTLRNLYIVMGLGGLWHGANWTFVVWGLLHATYLGAEHLLQPIVARIPAAIRESRVTRAAVSVVTFQFVCLAWVFFRARSVSAAGAMLEQLLLPTGLTMNFHSPVVFYLALGAVAILIGLLVTGRDLPKRLPAWAWGASAAVMLFLTIFTWGDANEFIYFRF
jgi:D-alanyl-lipoteichoic acid acyltransferase DltB (MBOAT superfamily)